MTKRDAIEAMARAMQDMEWTGNQPLNVHDDAIAIAITAYNTIAEMAKAERQSHCSMTGHPLTVRQQFESECG